MTTPPIDIVRQTPVEVTQDEFTPGSPTRVRFSMPAREESTIEPAHAETETLDPSPEPDEQFDFDLEQDKPYVTFTDPPGRTPSLEDYPPLHIFLQQNGQQFDAKA